MAASLRLAEHGQQPAPGPSGVRWWWWWCGETISAFEELRLGVLSRQRGVCGGLRNWVKVGAHQGVTTFTKSRGIAEKMISLWAPVLRTLLRVSPKCVHLSDLPRNILTKHEPQAFTIL